MGLSNEERVGKTYWAFMGWRYALVDLHDVMPREWSEQRAMRDVVSGWITRVDRMTGRLIAGRDANSAYWIMGPTKAGYRSHFDKLEVFNDPVEKSPEYGSYHTFESMKMVQFVERLGGGEFKTEVYSQARVTAAWWTMWQHVDNILYPIYRYKDDLFPSSLHDELVALFGEIANRRYDIIAGTSEKESVRDEVRVEQAVLAKWKLYQIHLEAADPWKKLSKKQRGSYDQVRRHKPFPGDAIITKIGKMSLAQVADALKKHEDAEWERERKQANKRDAEDAKKPQKIDGVLGPKMRSADELHRIVDTSPNRDEALAAGEELSVAHHTYANWKAIVDARLNPKKKSKKKRR